MPYDPKYESSLIRGDEDPRAWDLTAEILKCVKPTDVLLDVGCGTLFKTLNLASHVERIVGVEPNVAMRAKARENIARAGVRNVTVVDGVSERLPFADESFDVVICLMAQQEPGEFHRVVKTGGWVISEQVGNRNLAEITECFGDDERGPRGYFAGRDSQLTLFTRAFKALFREVEIRVGTWDSYLTREGLTLLLELIPLVRGFDRDRDRAALDAIEARLSTPRGIHVFHERLLIQARR